MEKQEIIFDFYFGDSTTNRKRLFQDAISNAKFGKVLYIVYEEFEELPQLSQDLSSVNKHYMKMISFLYAKKFETLLEILSTLPEWQNIPTTIILDDISKYCSKEDIQKACGIVAFIIDTAKSCSRIANEQCRLKIGVNEGMGQDFYYNVRTLYEVGVL